MDGGEPRNLNLLLKFSRPSATEIGLDLRPAVERPPNALHAEVPGSPAQLHPQRARRTGHTALTKAWSQAARAWSSRTAQAGRAADERTCAGAPAFGVGDRGPERKLLRKVKS